MTTLELQTRVLRIFTDEDVSDREKYIVISLLERAMKHQALTWKMLKPSGVTRSMVRHAKTQLLAKLDQG